MTYCHVVFVNSSVFLLQDIARYINASKGDYDAMRQIEEVEQSLVDYRGPALLQCGRYHLDGELRIKSTDQSGAAKKQAPIHV